MTKRAGCGCGGLGLGTLGVALGGVLAVTLMVGWLGTTLARTDEAKWGMGLVFAMGTPIVGIITTYEFHQGTVISIKRTEKNGKELIFANVVVEYPAPDGTTRQFLGRVSRHSSDFRRLEPGMRVSVLTCKTDPKIAHLLGHFGGQTCPVAR